MHLIKCTASKMGHALDELTFILFIKHFNNNFPRQMYISLVYKVACHLPEEQVDLTTEIGANTPSRFLYGGISVCVLCGQSRDTTNV